MYLKHFGLIRRPFDNALRAEELFLSAHAQELLSRLKYLLQLKGIGLVTGESGCGKTAILRKAAAALNPGAYRVYYITLTTGHALDMLKTVAYAMGITPKRGLSALFHDIRDEIARKTAESNVKPVLIIDEAQYLKDEALVNLRLLSNYEMDSESRLSILLLGQPEIKRRLALSIHEALTQRLTMRYQLGGLTQEEMPRYVRHRLELAGTTAPLIDPAALEAIYQFTHGICRKVNAVCHNSLIAAASASAKMATVEHVRIAIAEIAMS
jgi:type II secretory pathway predicted ATPase ExeA